MNTSTMNAMSFLLEQVASVVTAECEMIERFARHVSALGYSFAECRLEVEPGPNGNCKRTVVVVGKPCFETVTTVTPDFDNMKVLYTVTPRVIAWPEAK